MTGNVTPIRAQVIAAFDAGERNCAELGRRFCMLRQTVAWLLRKHGRQPMTPSESVKAQWNAGAMAGRKLGRPRGPARTPRKRLPFAGDPLYRKLRICLGVDAARAAMERA